MKGVSLDSRVPVTALVAAVLIAVAMAGGGYSGVAVGTFTAVVWLVLLVGVLGGRLCRVAAPAPLVIASTLLLALLALLALSLSWTSSDESGFVEVVRLSGYLGVFLLAGSVARPSWSGPVVGGIAVGIVAIALVALAARVLGVGTGDAALVEALPSASGRLSFPVGYWNALGALMALGLPPACWIASRLGPRLWSGAALAGFAPLLLVAFMSASRGALIAAAIGLVVFVSFATERRRAVAAAVIGIGSALPAIIVATSVPGLLDGPGDGSPGGAELAVVAALLAGMAVAGLVGARLLDSLAQSRLLAIRVPLRTAIATGLGVIAIVVVLAGPSQLIGDLREGTGGAIQTGNRTFGIVSASGSGRTQFWGVALDAFASEPVRGIGVGGYSAFWNRNGSLPTLIDNAHSEPLELLAELGVLGLACFAGFFVVVFARGVRGGAAGRRGGPRGAEAATLGVVAASLVGFAIDWTWQVPAVVVPVLIAAGTLVGPPAPALGLRIRSFRVPPAAMALGIVVVAVPTLWAAAVLAVGTSQLDASDEAFARGQLAEAAEAARSAAAIQPWASGPWTRLARIEQAADNLPAAELAIEAAIARNPDDLRAWLLAGIIQSQLGNGGASTAYAQRALALKPAG